MKTTIYMVPQSLQSLCSISLNDHNNTVRLGKQVLFSHFRDKEADTQLNILPIVMWLISDEIRVICLSSSPGSVLSTVQP